MDVETTLYAYWANEQKSFPPCAFAPMDVDKLVKVMAVNSFNVSGLIRSSLLFELFKSMLIKLSEAMRLVSVAKPCKW